MPITNSSPSTLPPEGRLYAMLVGTIIIVLTTVLPYLTLINVFLFAGIFLAGMIALHRSIMLFQVPISVREAFMLGCMVGFVGGVVSEGVTFAVIKFLHYRPGIEVLTLIVQWAREMAAKEPELHEQLQMLVAAEEQLRAPLSLSFSDIVINMLFSGTFYAPIAGLGGSFAVRRLKRKAARG